MATQQVKHALDLELELVYAGQGINNLDSGLATFECTVGIDVVSVDLPYSTWVELGKPNKLITLLRAE